jgi:hypothetical protein
MLTTSVQLHRNRSVEVLLVDAGTSRDVPTKLAVELGRCDREIAAALKALLTGSVPIAEALLWYTDWYRERELILLPRVRLKQVVDLTDLRRPDRRRGRR